MESSGGETDWGRSEPGVCVFTVEVGGEERRGEGRGGRQRDR